MPPPPSLSDFSDAFSSGSGFALLPGLRCSERSETSAHSKPPQALAWCVDKCVGRLITMCSLKICLVNLYWFAIRLALNVRQIEL